MVRPTSPIIAGSSVTTTYASSAATKSPAPARASGRTRVLNLWRRGGDADHAVEVRDVHLHRRLVAQVAEGAVEHRLADQVVGDADPHPGRHGPARAQLRQQRVDLLRRVCRRDLIRGLAVELVGGDVFRRGAGRVHRGQAGRRVEQPGHVGKGRCLAGRQLLEGGERYVEVDVAAGDHDLEADGDILLLHRVDGVAVRG